jgi:hypothetical protein
MTPDQWTRVLREGARAARDRSEYAADSAGALHLAVALAAMADETEKIAAGTAVSDIPGLSRPAAAYARDGLCRHCGHVIWVERTPGGRAWASMSSGRVCDRNPDGGVHEPRPPSSSPDDGAALGAAFAAIAGIVADLGHDPGDERVRAVITARLREGQEEAP